MAVSEEARATGRCPAACGLLIYCFPFRRVHFPVRWYEGQATTS